MEQRPSALTLHLRTAKDMSKYPARWDSELLQEVCALRNRLSPETRLIANGDVESVRSGQLLATRHSLDGVMIGRALIGAPYLFSDAERAAAQAAVADTGGCKDAIDAQVTLRNPPVPPLVKTLDDVIDVALVHVAHVERRLRNGDGPGLVWPPMRRQLRAYFKHHFPGVKSLALQLQTSDSPDQARLLLNQLRERKL